MSGGQDPFFGDDATTAEVGAEDLEGYLVGYFVDGSSDSSNDAAGGAQRVEARRDIGYDGIETLGYSSYVLGFARRAQNM